MAQTEWVMMPRTDYYNICEKVRLKTGTSDPLTSGQIPSLVEAISGSGGVVTISPKFAYSINRISGTNYGFSLGSDLGLTGEKEKYRDYYVNENSGQKDSFAICRIVLQVIETTNIIFEVINFAESSWDYGLFGNLDQALSLSHTADSTCYQSFKQLNSSSVQTVVYNNVQPGQYFIDIKFIKDQSMDKEHDIFCFKVKDGLKLQLNIDSDTPLPSDVAATSNDILMNKQAYVNGELITGSIPSKGFEVYVPGTETQIISQGQYLTGNQFVAGDPNLTPENIRAGVTLFGDLLNGAKKIVGTYTGSGSGGTDGSNNKAQIITWTSDKIYTEYDSITIPHNLGVAPDGFIMFTDDIGTYGPSSTEFRLVSILCYPYPNINQAGQPYARQQGYYIDNQGAIQIKTYIETNYASKFTSSSITFEPTQMQETGKHGYILPQEKYYIIVFKYL